MATLSSPLGGNSLRELAAAHLRRAIAAGDLQPGERLTQDKLSSELGISPGTVREALRDLEGEGLVVCYPNRGCYVGAISEIEFQEVVGPVRLFLEQRAILQSLKQGKMDWERIEAHLERIREAVATGDVAAVVESDIAFHAATVSQCDEQHTVHIWNAVVPRVRLGLYRTHPLHRRLDEIVQEHEVLLSQIRSGDKSLIEAGLREHIIEDAARMLSRDTEQVLADNTHVIEVQHEGE